MIRILFLVAILGISASEAGRDGAPLWLEVARVAQPTHTLALARIVRPGFPRGGRVHNLVLYPVRQPRTGPAVLLLVGPYESLAAAVVASYRLQTAQPWSRKGLVVRATPIWRLGATEPVPVRLDQSLAKACRALSKHDARRSETPWLAESLVARGYAYALPSAAIPSLEEAVSRFGPWTKMLVWDSRMVCADTPEIIGGPRPRLGPGPKPTELQRHPSGQRCLLWHLASVGQTLKLAWVPALEVARTDSYRKGELVTRWGPASVRIQLQTVGSGPEGPIRRLVLRHGAFPPVLQRIRIPRSCPPPYRLVFDRLGLALYDARQLICLRPTVRLPSPPVPALWKRARR